MTTQHAVPAGSEVGVWESGTFQPVYKVDNGQLELPNLAGQGALPLYNGRKFITNNGVLDVDFGGSVFNGWAIIAGGTAATPGGLVWFRAGGTSPTPFIIKGVEFNPLTVINNTVLTGTSGVGGDVTISTTDGHLFIENRSGSSQYWHITVFGRAY